MSLKTRAVLLLDALNGVVMVSVKAEIDVRLSDALRNPELEGSDESFHRAIHWPYKCPEQSRAECLQLL